VSFSRRGLNPPKGADNSERWATGARLRRVPSQILAYSRLAQNGRRRGRSMELFRIFFYPPGGPLEGE
jgi:hypothetical protein